MFAQVDVPGVPLAAAAQAALERAIGRLPIPKLMSYQLADGATTVHFVRPAHSLIALHGRDILPLSALGLKAGRATLGHRFQGRAELNVGSAGEYADTLLGGNVMADFAARRAAILAQLRDKAGALGLGLGPEEPVQTLLDEVTALVEMPTVYAGEFETEFLAVPQECLILTMRANQKYFPLFDAAGKLANRFLIVSNMRLDDARNIIEGNQRVVRPRLADARFFFETDKKTRLAERVAQLGSVTYHNKFGSQLARVQRLELLAEFIAARIGADVELARQAAHLAKADLVTGMVGEFPELQGLMGGYYAAHDGAKPGVVRALQEQYRLRASEATDADALVSIALYLADRTEALTGLFGIGTVPSGDKDPFGLRRAALGLISVFEALGRAPAGGSAKPLALRELLDFAAGTFAPGLLAAKGLADLEDFIYERYRNQLASQYPRSAVDAVIALKPPLDEVIARVAAVVEFQSLPEAEALAAANKRIRNILKKSDAASAGLRPDLLVEPAERALNASIDGLQPQVEAAFGRREYTAALKALAAARASVDTFFEQVMVNAEDAAVRANRLALLSRLDALMNRVADISRLAA